MGDLRFDLPREAATQSDVNRAIQRRHVAVVPASGRKPTTIQPRDLREMKD